MPATSASDVGSPDSEDGQPSEPADKESQGKEGHAAFLSNLPRVGIIALSLGLSVGILLIFSAIWMIYSRKKEAQELAARRALRRRRLQAHGEEAEFQRLMALRKMKEADARRKRPDEPARPKRSVKSKKPEMPDNPAGPEKSIKPRKTAEDAKITDDFSEDFDGFEDFDDFSE